MILRNLPIYQDPAEWPNAGHEIVAGPKAEREPFSPLFWLLVALLALAVGTSTWFVLPGRPATAPQADASHIIAAPDRSGPQLRVKGIPTGGPARPAPGFRIA